VCTKGYVPRLLDSRLRGNDDRHWVCLVMKCLSAAVIGYRESQLTMHTSPRFISHVSHDAFRPFKRLRLALFVPSHLYVTRGKCIVNHVGSHKILDELTS